MEELPVHTIICDENRKGGLLLCGINHGYSKDDERQDVAGIDRSESHKSFFSDNEANDYPFRNRIVSWFELWGYELARSKPQAGRFDRSIIQTNWLQTCSNNMRGINTQRACIEDHELFLETCSALNPGIILFFGKELLWAFTSPALSPKVETIFGAREGEITPAYSRGRAKNEDGEWFSLVESGCSCQNTIQEDHSPWVKAYPPGRPPATALSVSS